MVTSFLCVNAIPITKISFESSEKIDLISDSYYNFYVSLRFEMGKYE